MITLFTIPKAYAGESDTLQRNALRSWLALRPAPEIVLLGDDPGVAEAAAEYGVKHVLDVARNEYGTPLLPDVLAKGEAAASHDLVMYINADIMLPPDFMLTIARLVDTPNLFAVGQRWDVTAGEPLALAHGWNRDLLDGATLHASCGLDYFIYRKGTLGTVPPFAIGRWVWDNWLMWHALNSGLHTVDLSAALKVFHPRHDHSHVEGGFQAGPEYARNRELGAGMMRNTNHAAHSLSPLTVSVFGLGKLGAPMLAGLAGAGLIVIGVDTDAEKVDAINARRAPVVETGLQEALEVGAYTATLDGFPAVIESDASFVIVPTPSGPDGAFVLDLVQSALWAIGQGIRQKADYHLVVITSTVMPGDMARIKAALEEASGKVCGVDFGLCYSPEFIALGSVLHDWLNPDYVLIGESDPRAGDMLEALYATVCHNNPPAVRTNWINAEVAKIAQNAAVVAKIELFNQFARLCNALPGANVDEVSRALGHDRRIGPYYATGGLAPGGPCFPRDCRALLAAGLMREVDLPLLASIQASIVDDHEWLIDEIARRVFSGATVGLVGAAYKPHTPVVEESASLHVADGLRARGYKVLCHDPLAPALDGVQMLELGALVAQSDVLVLMLRDRGLAAQVASLCAGTGKRLLDPWRLLPEGAAEWAIGVGA